MLFMICVVYGEQRSNSKKRSVSRELNSRKCPSKTSRCAYVGSEEESYDGQQGGHVHEESAGRGVAQLDALCVAR